MGLWLTDVYHFSEVERNVRDRSFEKTWQVIKINVFIITFNVKRIEGSSELFGQNVNAGPVQWLNRLISHLAVACYKGTGSYPSCSTSNPGLCLRPWKAM